MDGLGKEKKGHQKSSPVVNGYLSATNYKLTNKQRYIKALSGENPKTHKMVCTELGLTPSSYNTLKRKLENQNILFELEDYKEPCKETGNYSMYLTTNKELAAKHGLTAEINAVKIQQKITWIKGKYGKAEPQQFKGQTKLF